MFEAIVANRGWLPGFQSFTYQTEEAHIEGSFHSVTSWQTAIVTRDVITNTEERVHYSPRVTRGWGA